MARSKPTIEPVDLEPLDEFLTSDRAPDNGMGLSDLDGFLTGIVVGPELVMPSEWLPHIWGGDEPKFSGVKEAQTVIGIIMARYNEIIEVLDADPDAFDPVFWEGPQGQIIVTDWAAGFIDAVKLRPKAWEPLIKHKEARVLMVPLIVLGADDPDHLPFGTRVLPKEEVKDLLENGGEIIPEAVVGIRAFWREHRANAPTPKAGRTKKPAPSTMPETTHIIRASLKARVYREIEIQSMASLEKLAEAIIAAYGFDLDHAYGFFSKLTGNIYQSPIRYELFADMEMGGTSRSVKRTRVAQAFPKIGSKMLFLFDYGDEWKFIVEVKGIGKPDEKARYPNTISSVGKSPQQYDDPDDEC